MREHHNMDSRVRLGERCISSLKEELWFYCNDSDAMTKSTKWVRRREQVEFDPLCEHGGDTYSAFVVSLTAIKFLYSTITKRTLHPQHKVDDLNYILHSRRMCL